MPIKMLMPALSPTMKEGKLGKWIKKEGEEIRIISEADAGEEWNLKSALVRRSFSPKLRAYLGKGVA